MKLINSKNNRISLSLQRLNFKCNKFNKSQRPCLYLLMGFIVYLGPLVNVEGATLISTILLIDVDMERLPLYIYVQTSWTEHTKTTTREPLVGNPR